MTISSCIHVAANGIISFFFYGWVNSIVHMYRIFFSHSSVVGHDPISTPTFSLALSLPGPLPSPRGDLLGLFWGRVPADPSSHCTLPLFCSVSHPNHPQTPFPSGFSDSLMDHLDSPPPGLFVPRPLTSERVTLPGLRISPCAMSPRTLTHPSKFYQAFYLILPRVHISSPVLAAKLQFHFKDLLGISHRCPTITVKQICLKPDLSPPWIRK